MRRILWLILPLVVLGCSPSGWKTVASIADDVTQIAKVLCLADHARAQHAKAFSVKEACDTVSELAPYIEQAKGTIPNARCVR